MDSKWLDFTRLFKVVSLDKFNVHQSEENIPSVSKTIIHPRFD